MIAYDIWGFYDVLLGPSESKILLVCTELKLVITCVNKKNLVSDWTLKFQSSPSAATNDAVSPMLVC